MRKTIITRCIALIACLFLALAPSRQASSASLQMRVTVNPNPMYSTTTKREYVQVATQPRIVCVAFVLYDDGREPVSFEHAETKVTGYNGIAIWRWYDTSLTHGGTASVSCTNGRVTRTVAVHFLVLSASRPRTAPAASASANRAFAMPVVVSPNPMVYGTNPARLTVYAPDGASCVAGVFYSNGQVPPTFSGVPQTVAGGSAWWIWHEETQSDGGTATVTCTYRGRTETATQTFTVRH